MIFQNGNADIQGIFWLKLKNLLASKYLSSRINNTFWKSKLEYTQVKSNLSKETVCHSMLTELDNPIKGKHSKVTLDVW